MSKIDITREHELGVETARERAEELAERLKEKLDLEWKWNGNNLEFERRGASGRIEVTATSVRVYVELSFILRPLHGMVEGKVLKYLDECLV